MTPEMFGEITCDEIGLDLKEFVPVIAATIKEEVNAFSEESQHPNGYVATLKLDILIGNKRLFDKFNWDLTSEKISPERFAEILAKDLELEEEFKIAIVFAIRSQVAFLKRTYKPPIEDPSPVKKKFRISKRKRPFPQVLILSDLQVARQIKRMEHRLKRIRSMTDSVNRE